MLNHNEKLVASLPERLQCIATETVKNKDLVKRYSQSVHHNHEWAAAAGA